jgi:lipopolysaccharide biosynthesis regulator YciM
MDREDIEEAIEVLEDASAEMLMETGDKNYYIEAIAVLRQALVDADDTSALVLADALEELDVQFSHTGLCGEAADELRRLHEVNQDLLASVVELLNSIQPDRDWHKAKRARAAIAKATGEKA